MHARKRAVGVWVSATLAASAAVGCGGPGPEDETLEARQAEFVAALASLDADRVGAFFAEDAVLHVADRPAVTGGASIREFYRNVFGFMAATEATTEGLRASDGGDLGYAWGSTSNEFRGPDGPVGYAGKFLIVWRKVEDDWMIAAYGITSDGPPEGAGAGPGGGLSAGVDRR